MRKREQGSQEEERIGLRETVPCERLPQFLQLGLRTLFAVKLQKPLQVLDNGIEGTILVVGGAAEFEAGGTFGQDLLFERLHQPRFANPSFATEQHHLTGACLSLRPPLR